MRPVNQFTPDLVRYAAPVLKLNGQNTTHCGVIYRPVEAGPLFFLHFAEHLDLRVDALDPTYFFEDFALDESDCKFVAANCGAIALRNPKIPYGFSFRGVSFDPTSGDIRLADPDSALTCATFVLVLLETSGFALLIYDEWTPGVNDEWALNHIKRIEEKGADKKYLRRLRSTLGTVARFRPEEVVGACPVVPWPVGFEAASEAADRLLQQLR